MGEQSPKPLSMNGAAWLIAGAMGQSNRTKPAAQLTGHHAPRTKCLALTMWPPQRLGICHGPIQEDGSCKAHSDAAKDDDPSREHQLELR